MGDAWGHIREPSTKVQARVHAAGTAVGGLDEATRRRLVRDAREGVRAVLTLIGYDPDTPALADTPAAWLESVHALGAVHLSDDDLMRVLEPVPVGPPNALAGTSWRPGPGDPLYVGPVPFRSLCEHHLSPWCGVMYLGHVPRPADWREGYAVLPVQLESLGRHYATGLTTPRRIGALVAETIRRRMAGAGAAVRITVTSPCPFRHHHGDTWAFDMAAAAGGPVHVEETWGVLSATLESQSAAGTPSPAVGDRHAWLRWLNTPPTDPPTSSPADSGAARPVQ